MNIQDTDELQDTCFYGQNAKYTRFGLYAAVTPNEFASPSSGKTQEPGDVGCFYGSEQEA